MDASFKHTTTHPTPENVILPVTFVHSGNAVLSGTSYGCARITSSKDWGLVEKLPHERKQCDVFQTKVCVYLFDSGRYCAGRGACLLGDCLGWPRH